MDPNDVQVALVLAVAFVVAVAIVCFTVLRYQRHDDS
jgi:hypothetical protein